MERPRRPAARRPGSQRLTPPPNRLSSLNRRLSPPNRRVSPNRRLRRVLPPDVPFQKQCTRRLSLDELQPPYPRGQLSAELKRLAPPSQESVDPRPQEAKIFKDLEGVVTKVQELIDQSAALSELIDEKIDGDVIVQKITNKVVIALREELTSILDARIEAGLMRWQNQKNPLFRSPCRSRTPQLPPDPNGCSLMYSQDTFSRLLDSSLQFSTPLTMGPMGALNPLLLSQTNATLNNGPNAASTLNAAPNGGPALNSGPTGINGGPASSSIGDAGFGCGNPPTGNQRVPQRGRLPPLQEVAGDSEPTTPIRHEPRQAAPSPLLWTGESQGMLGASLESAGDAPAQDAPSQAAPMQTRRSQAPVSGRMDPGRGLQGGTERSLQATSDLSTRSLPEQVIDLSDSLIPTQPLFKQESPEKTTFRQQRPVSERKWENENPMRLVAQSTACSEA